MLYLYLQKDMWDQYTPYKKCKGVINWHQRNKKTWRMYVLEIVGTALLALVVNVVLDLF